MPINFQEKCSGDTNTLCSGLLLTCVTMGGSLLSPYSLGRARGRPLLGGQKAPVQVGNGGLKEVAHSRAFAF